MTKTDFNWDSNEEQDDFTCKVDGYCLRAEEMQSNVWWWCVYDPSGDQPISSWTTDEWCKTAEDAKNKAQLSFLHLQESKIE
jgi:hypothetical protein